MHATLDGEPYDSPMTVLVGTKASLGITSCQCNVISEGEVAGEVRSRWRDHQGVDTESFIPWA